MMARVAARLESVDPGFARTRHGARTACATVLSGLTLAVVTSMFGVAEPLRITLFGAGACFFGALLVTDPRRSDRAQTFGWASVVSAVAIVATVELSRIAVWAAVAFLILQMFLSYALRPWSLRAGNLAVIGALITFLAGAGRITSDRIGWFVLASAVGFAWVTVSEFVILPDDPVRTLKRSVDVFCRSAGYAVTSVVDALTTTCDGNAPHRAAKSLRRSLDRVMRCRTVIASQVSVDLLPGFGPHDVEQLRVALYCAERGVEEVVNQTNDPRWIAALPDDLAGSIVSALQTLANALRDNIDAQSLDALTRELESLSDRLHHATTTLAALTTVGAAQQVAQTISQATALATALPGPPGTDGPSSAATAQTTSDAPPAAGTLTPTMALAIQAAIAASIPDNIVWTVVVVTIGVFFTIASAPVSYPAMVFCMSIALVPLFATDGRYLDLIWDKAVAALIGGCVAAVVAFTVVPIRLARLPSGSAAISGCTRRGPGISAARGEGPQSGHRGRT
jgi:hypothetical protein